MPFTIQYDPSTGNVAVMGLVSGDEVPEFNRQWGAALSAMKGGANWLQPLMGFVAAYRESKDNDHRVNAIKMWRDIAKIETTPACNFMDPVLNGDAPPPNGTEHPDMSERDLQVWLDRLPKGTKAKPAAKRSRGNWHGLFCDVMAHAQHFAPENNEYNLADPYGFKEVGVRMWRSISEASYVDAKAYVEALIAGKQPIPQGTEHGDISDDAIGESARLFSEAKARIPEE